MPGTSVGNRQLTTAKWLTSYSKKGTWIKIYRLKDQTIAKKVARYADTHYYSSKGTSTKDIFPDYGLTPHLYTTNPTYCSKLVFDAYWYGSGSAPVMKAASGFVFPYSLIDYFNTKYKPSLNYTINN